VAEYSLYRVHPNGSKEEFVSEHATFEEGWSAGTHAVTVEDRENAYSLYRSGVRVGRFGHSRLMRQAGALEQLSSSLVGAL
jgi:hypothetical protein